MKLISIPIFYLIELLEEGVFELIGENKIIWKRFK